MMKDNLPIWVYRGAVVLLLSIVGYFLQALHTQQQQDHDLLIELKTTQAIHSGELAHLRERVDREE